MRREELLQACKRFTTDDNGVAMVCVRFSQNILRYVFATDRWEALRLDCVCWNVCRAKDVLCSGKHGLRCVLFGFDPLGFRGVQLCFELPFLFRLFGPARFVNFGGIGGNTWTKRTRNPLRAPNISATYVMARVDASESSMATRMFLLVSIDATPYIRGKTTLQDERRHSALLTWKTVCSSHQSKHRAILCTWSLVPMPIRNWLLHLIAPCWDHPPDEHHRPLLTVL